VLREGFLNKLTKEGEVQILRLPFGEKPAVDVALTVIEKLGREGWDLVSIDWQGENTIALFKTVSQIEEQEVEEMEKEIQKWEYLYVYFDENGKVLRVNGEKPFAYGKEEFIHNYMNQVGDEGWELASHVIWAGAKGPSNWISFKRPKIAKIKDYED
jgi:hypothetical protein